MEGSRRKARERCPLPKATCLTPCVVISLNDSGHARYMDSSLPSLPDPWEAQGREDRGVQGVRGVGRVYLCVYRTNVPVLWCVAVGKGAPVSCKLNSELRGDV